MSAWSWAELKTHCGPGQAWAAGQIQARVKAMLVCHGTVPEIIDDDLHG
ncbi:hypothetical protein OROMI_026201 [Orobanche minor]